MESTKTHVVAQRTVKRILVVILCVTSWILGMACPLVATAQTSFTSATGVRVIVQPDPSAETVAVCVFVRAGLAEEDGVGGVGRLTARALFGSNYQHSADAVRRTIYATGGSLESSWTPDYTVYTCVTTPGGFRDAMNLMAEAVKSAEFDAETLNRARHDVLTDTARLESDPFEIAYALLRSRIYAGSPYRLPYGLSDSALRQITPMAMNRFLHRRYTPQNTVIAVAGHVTVDEARRAVENQFVDFDRRGAKPPSDTTDESIAESSAIQRRAATTTTAVLVASRAPSVGDADYPAFVVLNAALGGGKSSRLFRRVRDTAAIGYSVGTYFPALARPSHLIAYVEFDGARSSPQGATGDGLAARAEQLLHDTVHSAIDSPPNGAEMERAKRYAIGTHALAHERVRDRAFHLGLYETLGVGYPFDAGLAEKLDAVTAEDVARVARKYLAATVVATVGPQVQH